MGISDVCGKIFGSCCGGMRSSSISRHVSGLTDCCVGRSRDSIYDPVLADSEREAVADLLGFLENVHNPPSQHHCTRAY
jgi:vacuolar protein 8